LSAVFRAVSRAFGAAPDGKSYRANILMNISGSSADDAASAIKKQGFAESMLQTAEGKGSTPMMKRNASTRNSSTEHPRRGNSQGRYGRRGYENGQGQTRPAIRHGEIDRIPRILRMERRAQWKGAGLFFRDLSPGSLYDAGLHRESLLHAAKRRRKVLPTTSAMVSCMGLRTDPARQP
jgi:hypothetical protein